MSEYIERDALIAELRKEATWCEDFPKQKELFLQAANALELQTADVVSSAAYRQVEWERNIALMQLAKIGKGLGSRTDDVQPVKRGRWILKRTVGDESDEPEQYWECSLCGCGSDSYDTVYHTPYCPTCGAQMGGVAEMYEKLVKSLRTCSYGTSEDCKLCSFYDEEDFATCDDKLMVTAADAIEELLHAAKKMHTWIFLNTGDEKKAYDECGLSDAMNAALGYGGRLEIKVNDDV